MHDILTFFPLNHEDDEKAQQYPAIIVRCVLDKYCVNTVKFDGEVLETYTVNTFGLAIALAGIVMSNIPYKYVHV